MIAPTGTYMIRFVRIVLLLSLIPFTDARAQDFTSAQAFNLGPGDVVKVKIWREKDLDGEFQVDETGRLTLPLLGAVTVTGMPWAVLRDSLQTLYRRELKAPAVSLTPFRRVYVLGEVTKPGLYLADPTISVAGVVAMAGGATNLGDMHRLRVMRAGKVVIDKGAIEGQLLSGVQSDDQIFVDQRSWFSRNSTFIASAAISVASIVVALLR